MLLTIEFRFYTVGHIWWFFFCFVFFLHSQNDQVLQGFSVDKGEFTCPLCRQFANSVLPCRPGRGTEAGTWHTPTNKKTSVLVKEVEELQEKPGLFPVSLMINPDSMSLNLYSAFS